MQIAWQMPASAQRGCCSSGEPPDGRKLRRSRAITPRLVLNWVNRADLFRIHGVGEEYSELLEASGVDGVADLRTETHKISG